MFPARSILTRHARAFTILEVLAVIAIIALSLAAIVPAFGRIVESASYTAAINRVTGALSLARAEAMRGKQTAVAFFFDLETQRTTLYILERERTAGSLTQSADNATFPCKPCNTSAFAFVPVANQAPITLPAGIGVYGLAMSAPVPDPMCVCENEEIEWYRGEAARESNSNDVERFWLFPRNDARLFVASDRWSELADNPDLAEWSALDGGAARYAETFFIRFDETGAILPSVEFGTGANLLDSYVEFSPPSDETATGPSTTIEVNPDESPVLFDPERYEFRDLIANRYAINREAQVRSVDYLAIVDLGRLAEQTGIASPWLVRPASDEVDDVYSQLASLPTNDPKAPFIDDRLDADTDAPVANPRSLTHRISRWIDRNAEVIGFNRATGEALRGASR